MREAPARHEQRCRLWLARRPFGPVARIAAEVDEELIARDVFLRGSDGRADTLSPALEVHAEGGVTEPLRMRLLRFVHSCMRVMCLRATSRATSPKSGSIAWFVLAAAARGYRRVSRCASSKSPGSDHLRSACLARFRHSCTVEREQPTLAAIA